MEKKKPRIMHVIGAILNGGCEKMFLETLDGLEKRGNSENIGCIISDRVWNARERCSARIIALGAPRTEFYPLRALIKLYEFPVLMAAVIRENPDILHIYHNTDDKFMAAVIGRILGKKVTIRKNMQNAAQPRMGRMINRFNYFLSDIVVSIFSDGIAELENEGVSPEKIAHIPNGKDIGKYKMERHEARKKLGIAENEFIIGNISRLDPLKNHETIVYALPELVKTGKKVKFIIVGDHSSDDYRKKLISIAEELGVNENVVFLGYREDVHEILPAFDVFVHPSLSDGLPGAVLEAMCAGLPIVASDAGGTKDLLEGCGIMLPAKDSKAFADALKKLMADPELRAEYGKKAQKAAGNKFSMDRMLQGYEEMFSKMVEKNV